MIRDAINRFLSGSLLRTLTIIINFFMLPLAIHFIRVSVMGIGCLLVSTAIYFSLIRPHKLV